jgi:hypothetical protein
MGNKAAYDLWSATTSRPPPASPTALHGCGYRWLRLPG